MLLSFSEIQKKVNDLGKSVGIPESDLHIFSSSPGDGRPHISYDGGLYNYIYAERGGSFLEKQRAQKMSCFIGLCLTLFINLLFNMNWKIVLKTKMGGELHLIKHLILWGVLVMNGD